MKKFLCGALCILMGVSAMAVDWPGWDCKDLKKVEAAKQAYLAEKSYYQVNELSVLAEILRRNPQTYADLVSIIDNYSPVGDWDKPRIDTFKSHLKVHIPYATRAFIVEAWDYLQKNPTDYAYYYVKWRADELKLMPEFQYRFMVDFAVENSDHHEAKNAISRALDLSTGIDEAVVKADLKKLNRIYSRKLLKDKAKWEPIVAEIRTVLETY